MKKQIKMYSVKLGMIKTVKERELSTNKYIMGKCIEYAKDTLSKRIKNEVKTEKWTKECVDKYKLEKEKDIWFNFWKSEKDIYNKLLDKEIDENKDITRELNPRAFNDFNLIAVFSNNITRMFGLDNLTEPTKDVIILECKDTDRKLLRQLIYNGLTVEGKRYRFFTASAGQTRLEKIQIISEELWNTYEKTLMCGLTIEDINKSNEKGININKFLAYLSLNGSATDEWLKFDIDRSIVIEDFETMVEGEVDYINKETFEVTKKTMDIPIPHSDGCGWVLPSLMNKNFMTRLPWVKGLLTPCDYLNYCKTKRKVENEQDRYKVIDIYGKEHDLVKEDIQIIFSKSQFKLWKYYDSWEQYKEYFKMYNCKANICNEEDDNFTQAKLNYQMWQTLTDITDEEIDYFINPSLKYIEKAHIDKNFMLNILGATEENKYRSNLQEALRIYPEMLKEKSIKEQLGDVIEKKSREVRCGRVNSIDATYTFLIPDIYAWMEFVFNGDKNPKGILENGKVSCKLYKNNEDGEGRNLVVNRSPHLYREHGCRKNILNEDTKKWFITNGCYTSCHDLLSKLLMYDVDGDKTLIISDKNDKFYSIAKRNMKGIVPLYYEMGKAKAVEINSKNIYESLTTAYDSGNVGKFSNCLTNIWNSSKAEEYMKEMKIICALNNWSIDSAKTLEMPTAPQNIEKILEKKFKKVPYFFKYAKNKKNTQVYKINKSTVNKFCNLVDNMNNTKFEFGNDLGRFDHKILLNNTDMKVNDINEDIKNKFLELNKRKCSSDDNLKRNTFYDVIRKEFFDYCKEINIKVIDAVDMFVKYVYVKNKYVNKNMMWNVFGSIILNNMKNNIKKPLEEGKYIMCKCCGTRVKNTNGKVKYCKACAIKQNIKKTNSKRKTA